MGTLDAVIFDVDGTLVDSERDGHRVAFNAAFHEAGLPDRWDVETYGTLLSVAGGKQRLAFWFESTGWSPEDAQALAARLHPRKTEIMRALIAEGEIDPRPGVVALLDLLDAHGVPMHVATTGTRSWVEPLLNKWFRGRFRTVTTGTEVPELKPDPAVYRAVLDLIGTAPGGTVAVEDSANGVNAAADAGLRCVAVSNAYTRDNDLGRALLVADSFTDPDLASWFRHELEGPRGRQPAESTP